MQLAPIDLVFASHVAGCGFDDRFGTSWCAV